MTLSPIVLFVYNRPDHTQRTVESLKKNELALQSELFIFSDYPKNDQTKESVDEVRKYIKTVDGFKKVTIIEQVENFGLAKSIITGVTDIVNKYGKIIVLEDDLVSSPYFLKFMNDALEIYKDDNNVASVHGYIYPIEDLPNTFFIKGADCWGWATWKRAWDIFEPDGQKLLDELKSRKLTKEADFNNSYKFTQMLKNQIKGKNNSWAIRWYMSAFLKDMLTLYPGKSYIQNIGNDDSGTHCSTTDVFHVKLNDKYKMEKIEVIENMIARDKIEKYFLSIKKTILEKVKFMLKRLI